MSPIDLSVFTVPKKCVIGLLPFSEEQRILFDAVCAELDYETYPNVQIMRVLKGWGLNAKKTSLAQHRNRDCMCFAKIGDKE